MKKNMLTILVLILVVVNLTLTAFMVFTVVPNAQRTDKLITKVLSIIDLELESPLPSDINVTYNITDVEKYVLDEITANLATSPDGKAHYTKINSSLTINSADEDYDTLNPKVDTMKSDIISIIVRNVQKYTFEELSNVDTQTAVKEQVLADIQMMFDSKFIVDCTLYFLIQ